MDYLLGVNYWSRSGALFMWEEENWNPQIVEEEVLQMKRLGMNCCRSFIFSPTFMSEANRVDEDHLKRFDEFLTICEKHSLSTIPTFIVGHMSGQNWDFPFRNGRDLYSDEFMIRQQCLLVKRVVEICKSRFGVRAYLLSNEMPLYGGNGAVTDVIWWAEKLVEAVRAEDPDKPVGVGDGCWNAFGGNNGFDLRGLSEIADFFGPHMYVSEPDTYRHSMIAELLIRFCKRYGLPVIMEEFGASSSHASDDAVALYYEEVFFNTFMAGGKGNLSWCLSDFPYVDIEPYVHHPFELRFGILDDRGREKPAALKFRRFDKFLKEFGQYRPLKAEAAIVVPSAYNERFPFSNEDFAEQRGAFLQCAVLASKAGFDVDFVDEDSPGSWEDYKLLLLPCARRLLATSWDKLLDFASGGGTVYWSYYAGSSSIQQGTWMQDVEAFTGSKFHRRYGLPDFVDDSFKVELDGNIWEVRCGRGSNVWERSILRVTPSDNVNAERIGEDLWYIQRPMGSGKVLFANFPFEQLLSVVPSANDYDQSFLLYRRIAQDTGVEVSHTDNPMIRARRLRREEEVKVLIQNVSWEAQGCSSITASGRKKKIEECIMEPKQTIIQEWET